MKKHMLFILISFLLLTGCASNQLVPRHDVALSFDSERIAYDVAGKGETALIFVHGWSCDGRYWQKQIPVFANGFQVITVDLAGHGHSSLDRSNFTMLSFAKDVKAIIDKEEIDRAILVGHSMGGGVIAEAARLMPGKVVGIVGVDTLQNVAERTPQGVIDEMVQPFEADFRSAAKNFVSSMFPEGSDQQLVNWVIEDMSSAPKGIALSAFRNYLGQYVNGEAATVFNDIAIPVVSINARLWPTAPEENRKYIKNYQLFYIEETGHFPMLEKPEEFNMLLRKAINSIESESDNSI
ncbi:Pimeloyl-ACP methyl ester carboxylesterase [Marinobacter sp. es.048]|uniref:alpha/beta fold hydrolase n=1 Tax=Marinobacter sp. es.048 TaxID=1761795 RepID=UPI000B58D7DF|nr:alpha/beta hydrolase [Marinobacter sp. es.048]SNC75266.1 Pimeloyl-ACP methyl ester carboxylesterase [Marinobacter sp. es.048]